MLTNIINHEEAIRASASWAIEECFSIGKLTHPQELVGIT